MGVFDRIKKLLKKGEDSDEKALHDKLDKDIKKDYSVESASKFTAETTTEPDSIAETTTEPDSIPETASEADSIPETTTEPDSIPEITSEPDSVTDPSSDREAASDPEISRDKINLDEGLKKTKKSFFGKLARTVAGKSTIDDVVLDDIEEALITSDIGVETTLKIIDNLEERVKKDKYINTSELNNLLKEEISLLMEDSYKDIPSVNGPYVIMVVGVNGVGKTTTIGKIAYKFKAKGKKVILGAADTFRAAAVDQLVIWADKVGVEIVRQEMGADPASVAFDTIQSAKANGADVVIIDTAGRLHNNVNLMRELSKIRDVMKKVIPEAPHDVMLVLDASTGQNAIEQAKQFISATKLDSITMTKLDGTAKGGVVIGISDQFKIPVRYIGVGEGMADLQIFNKEEFINSLFN